MEIANVSLSIMSDGDRTVVEASYHSYPFPSIPVIASAGREPGDKSDREIGEALAAARALRKIAKRLEKRATGKMKHREDCRAHAKEVAESKSKQLDVIGAEHVEQHTRPVNTCPYCEQMFYHLH